MNRILQLAFTLTFALLIAAAQIACPQQAAVAEKSAANPAPLYSDSVPGVGPIRNEDWFVKTWHDRRGKFADQKSEQQNAVVFFGDSITQGWSDDFRGRFAERPHPALPRGRGGFESRQPRHQRRHDARPARPRR